MNLSETDNPMADGLFHKAFDGLPAPRMAAIQLRGLRRRLAVYRVAPEALPEKVAEMEAEIAALEAVDAS